MGNFMQTAVKTRVGRACLRTVCTVPNVFLRMRLWNEERVTGDEHVQWIRNCMNQARLRGSLVPEAYTRWWTLSDNGRPKYLPEIDAADTPLKALMATPNIALWKQELFAWLLSPEEARTLEMRVMDESKSPRDSQPQRFESPPAPTVFDSEQMAAGLVHCSFVSFANFLTASLEPVYDGTGTRYISSLHPAARQIIEQKARGHVAQETQSTTMELQTQP